MNLNLKSSECVPIAKRRNEFFDLWFGLMRPALWSPSSAAYHVMCPGAPTHPFVAGAPLHMFVAEVFPGFAPLYRRMVPVRNRIGACFLSLAQALSELMERSVSQLLSVRREHNCTKLDVEELKHLWDITVAFIQVGGATVPSARNAPERGFKICLVVRKQFRVLRLSDHRSSISGVFLLVPTLGVCGGGTCSRGRFSRVPSQCWPYFVSFDTFCTLHFRSELFLRLVRGKPEVRVVSCRLIRENAGNRKRTCCSAAVLVRRACRSPFSVRRVRDSKIEAVPVTLNPLRTPSRHNFSRGLFFPRTQSVERLSGSNGYKLRSTLLSQAKAFVEARHEANKQTLIKRLDAEKWTQVGALTLVCATTPLPSFY